MKKNRFASFLIVFIIYVIAGVIGIYSYINLEFSFWLNLLIADVIATVVVFLFSLIFNNASVYDPYWSVQPIVIVLAFYVTNKITVSSTLLLIAIIIWGVRLTVNWGYTFKNLYHQDWRYSMLKEKTKFFYPFINFIGIHMIPTLVVYVCVLPACFVIVEGTDSNAFTYIFFVGALMSVTLQCVSDIQMHKYRKNKTTNFIRDGIWKYSRHPNYLAEILMWWFIGLMCVLTMLSNYYLLIGALLNTLLFLFISIPMADKRQSRKDGFEDYKQQTRMLLPIKKI